MRRPFLIFVALLVVAAGCERYVASKDPVRSLPATGPIPTNVQVLVNSHTVTLSWEVADASGVLRYRVFVADSVAGNFRLHDSTTGTQIVLDDLLMNRVYYFHVAAVLLSGLEWEPSVAVSARTGYLSIVIENGDEYTNGREVLVQINTSNQTTDVILSEDTLFGDAHFEPFSPQKSFTLSDGDGLKTVYGRLQFADGSRSGELLSDDITLDTRSRIDSVFFGPGGTAFSVGDTIIFGLDAGESGGDASISFEGGERLELFDDGAKGDAAADDGVYTAWYVVPNNLSVNNALVTGNFADAAGNSAPSVTAGEPLNIFSAPLPVTLWVTALSTFEIELGWTRSVSDDFHAYRIYRSQTGVVSNDSDNSDLVTSIAAQSTLSHVDTTLEPNTAYSYRVYVYDNCGLFSGSNTETDTTLVNTPPEAVELVAYLDSDTVRFNWTASGEPDFESYRIYRGADQSVDSSGTLIQFVSDRSITSFAYGAPSGTSYYRVYVCDRHGLSVGSNVESIFKP